VLARVHHQEAAVAGDRDAARPTEARCFAGAVHGSAALAAGERVDGAVAEGAHPRRGAVEEDDLTVGADGERQRLGDRRGAAQIETLGSLTSEILFLPFEYAC
jgi:hypothetical protein